MPEPAYLLTFSRFHPHVKTRTLTITRVETPWNCRRQLSIASTLRSVTDGRVRLECFVYIYTILFLTLICTYIFSAILHLQFYNFLIRVIYSHVQIDSLPDILLRASRNLLPPTRGRVPIPWACPIIIRFIYTRTFHRPCSINIIRIFSRGKYASIHGRLRWKSCYARCHILDVVVVLVEANLFYPNSNRRKR